MSFSTFRSPVFVCRVEAVFCERSMSSSLIVFVSTFNHDACDFMARDPFTKLSGFFLSFDALKALFDLLVLYVNIGRINFMFVNFND